MKRITIIIALVLVSHSAWAGIIRYDTEAAFREILTTPYLFDDFHEYTYRSYVAPTLMLDENGYQVELSASGPSSPPTSSKMLYSLNGSMSTRNCYDPLVIDMTGSAIPVTAIGGYFWPTDYYGNNVTGNIIVTLSDGALYVMRVDQTSVNTFLGFGSDGSAFKRLEVSMILDNSNDYAWPTLDNLYAGTDPPNSVPESPSAALLSAGLFGLGAVYLPGRRKFSRRLGIHRELSDL